MTSLKKLFTLAICVTLSASLHAQLEVAQLFTKGNSTTGFGANLHVGFPVSKGDEISGEVGLYYFAPDQSHFIFVPLLLGYRHTLNNSGTGFYIEPFAGYSIGATDIQRVDGNGNPEAVYEQVVLCGGVADGFHCWPGDFRDIAQLR